MDPIARFELGIRHVARRYANREGYGNQRKGPNIDIGEKTILQEIYDLPRSHSSFLLPIYIDRAAKTITLPGPLDNTGKRGKPRVYKNPEAAVRVYEWLWLETHRHCALEELSLLPQ
ncbi:MAG: hypothetical protein V1725_04170 [archaeon]